MAGILKSELFLDYSTLLLGLFRRPLLHSLVCNKAAFTTQASNSAREDCVQTLDIGFRKVSIIVLDLCAFDGSQLLIVPLQMFFFQYKDVPRCQITCAINKRKWPKLSQFIALQLQGSRRASTHKNHN